MKVESGVTTIANIENSIRPSELQRVVQSTDGEELRDRAGIGSSRIRLDPYNTLSCPFSRGLDVDPNSALLLPVDFADTGMRGGGRALSDG
jgi:hypothetical protein